MHQRFPTVLKLALTPQHCKIRNQPKVHVLWWCFFPKALSLQRPHYKEVQGMKLSPPPWRLCSMKTMIFEKAGNPNKGLKCLKLLLSQYILSPSSEITSPARTLFSVPWWWCCYMGCALGKWWFKIQLQLNKDANLRLLTTGF